MVTVHMLLWAQLVGLAVLSVLGWNTECDYSCHATDSLIRVFTFMLLIASLKIGLTSFIQR